MRTVFSTCLAVLLCSSGYAADFLPISPFSPNPEEQFREFGFASTWNLEDFESGEVSKLGLIIESDNPWSVQQGFSVEGDAKDRESGFALEASHNSCAASFPALCPATVTLSFDRNVFETLPSYVGFVWTDAAQSPDNVFPYAKVVATNSLGEQSVQLIGSVPTGERPNDDSFIGLVDEAGVSSVQITVVTDGSGKGGHFAIDHFQYGTSATPGDTNVDGDVDFADFVKVSGRFGVPEAGWRGGDFNFDGHTGFPDFLELSGNFGTTERVPTGLTPEPASMALFLVGVCALLLGRKRRHVQ